MTDPSPFASRAEFRPAFSQLQTVVVYALGRDGPLNEPAKPRSALRAGPEPRAPTIDQANGICRDGPGVRSGESSGSRPPPQDRSPLDE